MFLIVRHFYENPFLISSLCHSARSSITADVIGQLVSGQNLSVQFYSLSNRPGTFIMDKDDRIARLRGVLATDAILGREFTFCIPSIRPPSKPTRRQKPLYSAKPSQLAPFQGPTLPIFSGGNAGSKRATAGVFVLLLHREKITS
jgi:hypothetical protein